MTEKPDAGLELARLVRLRQELNSEFSAPVVRWRSGNYVLSTRSRRQLKTEISRVDLSSVEAALERLERIVGVRGGRLARSDVLTLGEQFREGEREAADVFLASLIWGNGTTGYGTYRAAVALSVPRNGRSPLDVINESARCARVGDTEKAYRAMSNALWRIGPAFGTKFLYFVSPPSAEALVFDGVVAGWSVTGVPWLVNPTTAWRWDWETYSAYRKWCIEQFGRLRDDGLLVGHTSFRPDRQLHADVVEATIFSYLISLKRTARTSSGSSRA